jgi:uncharacterized membrane protein YadS
MTDTKRKPILQTEEWQPVIIGVLLIALVCAGLRFALPGFRWMSGSGHAAALAASLPAVEQLSSQAAAAGEGGLAQALDRVKEVAASRDRNAVTAAAAALTAAASSARDPALAKAGAALGKTLSADARATLASLFSSANLLSAGLIGLVFLLLSLVAVWLGGGRLVPFLAGFPIVYVLSLVSQAIAGNVSVTYWGLEYVIFALAIGLLISNTVGVPAWLRDAVKSELYIKIGLVILGAGILFPEILQAGAMGVLQALLVVAVVWYVCYWISRRLKVDAEFAAILSSAVSICGVSAAIAACGAIQGDKKKLSYTISLTLIVAVPMMVIMPWVARLLHFPEAVAGAWMGGTLDTTGSVVAASSLVGETAMKVGSIVKFSQNVFIGVAAFALSLWWAFRKTGAVTATGARAVGGSVGAAKSAEYGGAATRPSMRVIWTRFPKFVLGFLAASLVFSFLLSPGLVAQTKSLLTGLRTMWFGLAFVSVGLETKLTGLVGLGRGRPALAFVSAQLFNVFWTLLLAFLLFGGKLLGIPAFTF